MTLQVINAVGEPLNAETYCGLPEAVAYLTKRDVNAKDMKESDLLLAMSYIENLEFRGVKFSDSQVLAFPRIHSTFTAELSLNLIKIAQIWVSYYIHEGILAVEQDDLGKGAVIWEKADDFETRYSDLKSGQTASDIFTIPFISNALRPVISSDQDNVDDINLGTGLFRA